MRYWIYLSIIIIWAFLLDFVLKFSQISIGIQIIIMLLIFILQEVIDLSNKKVTINIHVNKDEGKETKGNG